MHLWSKKFFHRNNYTTTPPGGTIEIVGTNTVNFVFRYKKRKKKKPRCFFVTGMTHKYSSLLQPTNSGKDRLSGLNPQRVEVIPL